MSNSGFITSLIIYVSVYRMGSIVCQSLNKGEADTSLCRLSTMYTLFQRNISEQDVNPLMYLSFCNTAVEPDQLPSVDQYTCETLTDECEEMQQSIISITNKDTEWRSTLKEILQSKTHQFIYYDGQDCKQMLYNGDKFQKVGLSTSAIDLLICQSRTNDFDEDDANVDQSSYTANAVTSTTVYRAHTYDDPTHDIDTSQQNGAWVYACFALGCLSIISAILTLVVCCVRSHKQHTGTINAVYDAELNMSIGQDVSHAPTTGKFPDVNVNTRMTSVIQKQQEIMYLTQLSMDSRQIEHSVSLQTEHHTKSKSDPPQVAAKPKCNEKSEITKSHSADAEKKVAPKPKCNEKSEITKSHSADAEKKVKFDFSNAIYNSSGVVTNMVVNQQSNQETRCQPCDYNGRAKSKESLPVLINGNCYKFAQQSNSKPIKGKLDSTSFSHGEYEDFAVELKSKLRRVMSNPTYIHSDDVIKSTMQSESVTVKSISSDNLRSIRACGISMTPGQYEDMALMNVQQNRKGFKQSNPLYAQSDDVIPDTRDQMSSDNDNGNNINVGALSSTSPRDMSYMYVQLPKEWSKNVPVDEPTVPYASTSVTALFDGPHRNLNGNHVTDDDNVYETYNSELL